MLNGGLFLCLCVSPPCTSIFSNSNDHGYMDTSPLRSQRLAKMADKLKGKRVRIKRGAQKKNLLDERLWENLTSPEKQYYPKLWQNNLNRASLTPKTFWRYSYIALSSIGATVRVWKELMNFIDCPKHKHNKDDIPWTWTKNPGYKQKVNRYQDTDLEKERLMPEKPYRWFCKSVTELARKNDLK